MGFYNFSRDLKESEKSEALVIEYLKDKGCTHLESNADGRYDISYRTPEGIERTAEVKHDYMWEKTGNVAIEYVSRGKASGIATSKADVWFYFLNRLYSCNTGDL